MQQEKTNKVKAMVFWSLSAVCMAAIFWFSSRTAVESSEQSGFFTELLKALFGSGWVADAAVFIVRKGAHCMEFTGFALLLNAALYYTKGEKLPLEAIALTSLYAITDEVHQIFVEGRACRITDWAIDTLGAVLGTVGFLLLLRAVIKIKAKKKNGIDINSN